MKKIKQAKIAFALSPVLSICFYVFNLQKHNLVIQAFPCDQVRAVDRGTAVRQERHVDAEAQHQSTPASLLCHGAARINQRVLELIKEE